MSSRGIIELANSGVDAGIFQVAYNNQPVSPVILNNDFQRKWLYLENRSSVPLAIGATPSNSAAKPSTPFTVPPLSVTCNPIDPGQDVYITPALLALNNSMAFNSSNVQFPGNVIAIMANLTRNVLYQLQDEGAPFYRHLYPLESCMLISRRFTVASGAHQIIELLTFTGNAATVLLFPQSNNISNDACIVAMQPVITNYGATSIPADLIISPIHADGTGITLSTAELAEITPYSGNTANPAGSVFVNPVFFVNGCLGLDFFNNGGSNMNIRVTMWVGIPGHAFQGTI